MVQIKSRSAAPSATVHDQPAGPATTPDPGNAVHKAAGLSAELLTAVEAGQRAALDAVRKFVDTVDEMLPAIGGRPSAGDKVIDAALEMADKLVTTQYGFLRTIVHSADRSLTRRAADDP